MVIVRVPWEPELLDPWKAAWDCLIWKAMIPKVKAVEGELNRTPALFRRADLRKVTHWHAT